MTQQTLTCLSQISVLVQNDLNQLTLCLLLFFAAELIKKQDLERDELRPLYMDFQATTPMVTITNHVVMVTGLNI